jgi:hypothetical protein
MISVSWSSVFIAAIISVKVKYSTTEHMAMAFIKKMALWIAGGTVVVAQLFLVWWLAEQFVTDSPVSSHRLLLILLAMFSVFFTIFFILIDHLFGGAILRLANLVGQHMDLTLPPKKP